MRCLAFGLFLWVTGALAALAQTDQTGVHTGHDPAIEAVIGAQIDAFLADDFSRAFTYASPGIRTLFGTPEKFGAMVREGYPMVWRPGRVSYLELQRKHGKLWQIVMIRDGSGTLHWLAYQMIQTDGAWKINAVEVLRPPGSGV